MLTSEFQQELGALIRSLEGRIRIEPDLQNADNLTLDHIERAIITLAGLHIGIRKAMQ